jgi:hypothetical protein
LKFTLQGMKWRQVIAVLMIAVPWFLRDELAAGMEKKAADAQQVLTEENEQQQQQQQIGNQRDLFDRIGQIQAQLGVVEAKVDPTSSKEEIEDKTRQSDDALLGNFFRESATDLNDSAARFDELRQQVDLSADLDSQFSQVAAAAQTTAHELQGFDASASDESLDAQFDELTKAQSNLVDAYAKLSDAAEQDRDRSTSHANIARGVAWAFTAAGTLLIGNWKKLLGISGDSDEETAKAGPKSEE